MKFNIFCIFLVVLVGNSGQAFSQNIESHCKQSEKIFFNCKIKNSPKIVSICGTKDQTDTNAYLQYRFGKLNGIELEYPSKKTGNRLKLKHYFDFHKSIQYENQIVHFNIWGNKYQVYYTESGPDDENPVYHEEGGVIVNTKEGNSYVLLCDKEINVVHDLGMLHLIEEFPE